MPGFDIFSAVLTTVIVAAVAILIVISNSRDAKRHREMQQLLHGSQDGKLELDSHRRVRKKSIIRRRKRGKEETDPAD